MKIKQLLFHFFLGIVILFAVKEYIGGFELSKVFSFALVFILLYSVTSWLAIKVRVFFLLPRIIFLDILFQTLFIGVVMWICNSYIGGITLAPVKFSVISLLGLTVTRKSLGEFGTIGVVSFVIAVVYQGLIWLNSDK